MFHAKPCNCVTLCNMVKITLSLSTPLIFDICREEYFTPPYSSNLCVIISSDTETLWHDILRYPEAVVHSCSVKKFSLKVLPETSQETTCARVFF